MIVTVTMNPAIDKTVDIDSLIVGDLNRIKSVELDAGGKGINVSKTIRELGHQSIATGFLGGNSGQIIKNVLNEKNIENDFVFVDGETRTNTKVFEENGNLTELNEAGPAITKEQIDLLYKKLEKYATKDSLFVLAGSIPKGVDKNIYREMIEFLHDKGSCVLLDADGEVFRNSIQAKPDIIKPNKNELAEYMQLTHEASEAELIEAAKKLIKEGIKNVTISMGSKGAMIIKEDYHVKVSGLKVKAHSTVGAGDAMVAALAVAWDKNLSNDESTQLCIATSAGAVTTIGTKPPSLQVVEELKKQVIIKKIGE